LLIFEICSNSKFSQVKIFSNLKFAQIQKLLGFEICSDSKIAQIWNLLTLKNPHKNRRNEENRQNRTKETELEKRTNEKTQNILDGPWPARRITEKTVRAMICTHS
jgi:hypothetical protein